MKLVWHSPGGGMEQINKPWHILYLLYIGHPAYCTVIGSVEIYTSVCVCTPIAPLPISLWSHHSYINILWNKGLFHHVSAKCLILLKKVSHKKPSYVAYLVWLSVTYSWRDDKCISVNISFQHFHKLWPGLVNSAIQYLLSHFSVVCLQYVLVLQQ